MCVVRMKALVFVEEPNGAYFDWLSVSRRSSTRSVENPPRFPQLNENKETCQVSLTFRHAISLTQSCRWVLSRVISKRLLYSHVPSVLWKDARSIPVSGSQLITVLPPNRPWQNLAWHRDCLSFCLPPRQTPRPRHRRSVRPTGGESSYRCCR